MLQQQPGVHALSVVLVKARQHPQTLEKDKDATGSYRKSPTEQPSHLTWQQMLTWLLWNGSKHTAQLSASGGWDESRHSLG